MSKTTDVSSLILRKLLCLLFDVGYKISSLDKPYFSNRCLSAILCFDLY